MLTPVAFKELDRIDLPEVNETCYDYRNTVEGAMRCLSTNIIADNAATNLKNWFSILLRRSPVRSARARKSRG